MLSVKHFVCCGMDVHKKFVVATIAVTEYRGVTSYINFMNVNRQTWANARDNTEAVSAQTEEDKERTHLAMNNVHFRRALCFAVDRTTWNAQGVGEELAALSVRNSYTPATFVSLTEDTTVTINGEEVTFPAGTDYGEIMQAQIDADGVKITVYKKDSSAENGKGTGDGFDGWYSPENAVEELNIAIEELSKHGVTIDESNPIQVDLPFASNSTVYTNKANAYKQSVEASLGGKVIVNLISKAVTAPFALIGSMFGGEDMDLNNLQFASGSARLDEKTIKALNIVAKAMQDRPGIKIQIIGMASEKEDGEGLKEQLLMRDMRYAIYRDTTSATNAKVLTAAQIDKAIKQLYSESTAPNKPKNTDIEQMKAFLMKNQRVATADLKQLADRRAAAVRNYLIQKEKVAADRLFISTSETQRGDQVVPGVALGLQD